MEIPQLEFGTSAIRGPAIFPNFWLATRNSSIIFSSHTKIQDVVQKKKFRSCGRPILESPPSMFRYFVQSPIPQMIWQSSILWFRETVIQNMQMPMFCIVAHSASYMKWVEFTDAMAQQVSQLQKYLFL
jgi:hypothetical protein